MNAFQSPVMKEFTHQNIPLFFEESDLESMIFEFAMDANSAKITPGGRSWGKEDLVFPAKCFGNASKILLNDKYLKEYRKEGIIKFTAKEEDVDSITLQGPLSGIAQNIYFYDC